MPRSTTFYGWRVEDDDSRASYEEGHGINAESKRWVPLTPQNQDEEEQLLEEVELHLNWENRRATPFISVYTNYNHAKAEAENRAEEKENVVIYRLKITDDDRKRYGPIHYRKMKKLVEDLGSEIPDYVGNNADDEFIFLHHIPEEVIKRGKRFS